MKKLTKASIEELKQEMPVIDEEQQRGIVGGAYVYDQQGSYLGTDSLNDEYIAIMTPTKYNEMKSQRYEIGNERGSAFRNGGEEFHLARLGSDTNQKVLTHIINQSYPNIMVSCQYSYNSQHLNNTILLHSTFDQFGRYDFVFNQELIERNSGMSCLNNIKTFINHCLTEMQSTSSGIWRA